jgi:hypothetical protein
VAKDWVGAVSRALELEKLRAAAESGRYRAAAGSEVDTMSAATPKRAPIAVTFEVALFRAPRSCRVTRSVLCRESPLRCSRETRACSGSATV